ncbi:MAG TPA: hypothetical protein VFX59_01335 [Polyangiales bacterium]|nr:hypothetical protein [Polyangiales bacterium]
MTWSALAGYDRSLVARLSARHRAELGLLGGCWCWAALSLAAPMAYVIALLTHSAWLSLAVALGELGMVLQLVRLTVAGGGMPLDATEHRPTRTPLLWVGVLGVLFALPAQLPLWEHAKLVADQRATLLALHQRALAATPELADDARFARQLASCEFVILRLQDMCRHPAHAGRYALGYLTLLLAPLLFARAQARAARRAYERQKVAQAQRVVARDAASTQRMIGALLAPHRARP